MIACARCARPAFLSVHGHGLACAYHLREAYERRPLEMLCLELRPVETETDAPRGIVSSVRLWPSDHHDRLAIWNRGARVGELVVKACDGFTIAARLLGASMGGE